MRFWVVLPHVFGIEETPKPRDLRGEMDHDNLHFDIELQSQDFLAGFQRRLPRRDKHVARNPEPFQLVDHLAELCAPCEHAQLYIYGRGESRQHKRNKNGGRGGYTHLSVLFISPVQYVGRRLKGKVAYVIPLDDGGRWDIGFALRGRRDGGLHICQ